MSAVDRTFQVTPEVLNRIDGRSVWANIFFAGVVYFAVFVTLLWLALV